MKVCSKCKAEKPEAEFSKSPLGKEGLRSNCKACAAEHRLSNREKIAEYKKKYKAANREKIAEYQAKYQAFNREKIAAWSRAYYAANREKHAARDRAYYAANPEKASEKDRNRRARKRKAEGSHTAADIRSIFDKQQGLCANCQTKLFKSGVKKYHVDHIMPLKLGGSNWPANLQCLCPTCNLSKGAKHPTDWAKQQGRLL